MSDKESDRIAYAEGGDKPPWKEGDFEAMKTRIEELEDQISDYCKGHCPLTPMQCINNPKSCPFFLKVQK